MKRKFNGLLADVISVAVCRQSLCHGAQTEIGRHMNGDDFEKSPPFNPASDAIVINAIKKTIIS